MDERNALSELAERLIGWSDWFKDQRGTMMEHDISKAQRIVTELAKVKDKLGNPYLDDIENAYKKCRAIAEEGAGDGIKSS